MNPFDLPGPHFLAFYAALGVAVNVGLWLWRRWSERDDGRQPPKLTDPYAIAYLRGGREEALRVATVSLIDRGLLKATGSHVVFPGMSEEIVQRPLERAVLRYYKLPRTGVSIFERPPKEVELICGQYREELERQALVPGPVQRRARTIALVAALALLVGVAGTKICVALSRGRHNLAFLVILAAVCIFVTVVAARRPRTALGNRLLKDLRNAFRGLKTRAAQLTSGGATSEVILLASIWGLSALPALKFPYARTLYPKAARTGDNNNTSWYVGCGGGCGVGVTGTSGNDGGGIGGGGGCGGAGCGGGGCGGGCGGCGG